MGWVRMYTQNLVIMFVEKRRWWMALRWVSRCEDGKLLELAVEHVRDSKTERCVSTRRPLTLRSLTLYIYGAPILDVSRSHTTTQHSR